ncbi:MAG: carboxypeptidase-like regulatory domain-containing protein, partial [Mangrovibacterium sp.]
MMKLSVFLVCLSVFSALATDSYSQNTKISLVLKRTSIKAALKEIENNSNYLFLYNNDLINVDKIVDVDANNESIESVLNELFQGEAVKYVVMDRQIIISPDTSAPLPAAQESKITGTVRDSGGQTLPGVTVVVKGTTNGTITDMDGKFSIAAKGSDVLVFSFVGMQTVEFAANKTVIDVTMQDETIGLEEVVAIGYGVVKKSDVTGSVARVSAEDI